jgi:hypothetical protein
VARVRAVTERLAELRTSGGGEWRALARDVQGHARVLRVLGLRPAELAAAAEGRGGLAGWTAKRLSFFAFGAPVAALGTVVYFIPYRLTGVIERVMRPEHDVRATTKLLVGGILHVVWTIAAAVAADRWLGGRWGVAALLLLPIAGIVTLSVLDRWSATVAEARRFLLGARRRQTLAELRERQHALALRLRDMHERAHA